MGVRRMKEDDFYGDAERRLYAAHDGAMRALYMQMDVRHEVYAKAAADVAAAGFAPADMKKAAASFAKRRLRSKSFREKVALVRRMFFDDGDPEFRDVYCVGFEYSDDQLYGDDTWAYSCTFDFQHARTGRCFSVGCVYTGAPAGFNDFGDFGRGRVGGWREAISGFSLRVPWAGFGCFADSTVLASCPGTRLADVAEAARLLRELDFDAARFENEAGGRFLGLDRLNRLVWRAQDFYSYAFESEMREEMYANRRSGFADDCAETERYF